MPWYHYVSWFFGGAFVANSVPHLVNGMSGRGFPSPFASPPGRGLSSPLVNVAWGSLNLLIGYFLVFHVGAFHLRSWSEMPIAAVGAFLMSLMLANHFGGVLPND